MTKTWKDQHETRKSNVDKRKTRFQRLTAMRLLTSFNTPVIEDETIIARDPAVRSALAEYIRRGGYFDPRSM